MRVGLTPGATAALPPLVAATPAGAAAPAPAAAVAEAVGAAAVALTSTHIEIKG